MGRRHTPDVVNVAKASATGTALIGAAVAIVLGIRRQHSTERTVALNAEAQKISAEAQNTSAEAQKVGAKVQEINAQAYALDLRRAEREDVSYLRDRFTTAAEQLGHDADPVRLAGVYAMATLADDWLRQNNQHEAQVCVDVLCGYVRTRRDYGDSEVKKQADTEIRQTIVRTITNRLQPDDTRGDLPSWSTLDLDFTGSHFDGDYSFHGAQFTAGKVTFDNVRFSGGTVSFDCAGFAGGYVSFKNAGFTGGYVSFKNAGFTGGETTFSGAGFTGSTVHFGSAKLTGGKLFFNGAKFKGGLVTFTKATISNQIMSFTNAAFEGSRVNFDSANFSGKVSFNQASINAGSLYFGKASFVDGQVTFNGAKFTGGETTFDGAKFKRGLATFTKAEFAGSVPGPWGAPTPPDRWPEPLPGSSHGHPQ
ncbi:hypothetical protein [Branchiibius cervicis]|uniref:Pentapeptide repeat-containing protein n=1 Tax=Branchiibius cervicis TaxID=908252 RepID=A0ABW2AT79_9MICO